MPPKIGQKRFNPFEDEAPPLTEEQRQKLSEMLHDPNLKKITIASPGSRNSRREEDKRAEDLSFIALVRHAPLNDLLRMEKNLSHKNAPAWKRAAVSRALNRKKNEEI